MNTCNEYISEYLAEGAEHQTSVLVGLDGDAPVSVQGISQCILMRHSV